MENNKNNLECIICLEQAVNPVATLCGHIFCWHCLKSWTSRQGKKSCPVCKNGIDLNKVVRLFTNNTQNNTNNNNNNDTSDIPRAERIQPERNNFNTTNFVTI